jgi:hypothetical protein
MIKVCDHLGRLLLLPRGEYRLSRATLRNWGKSSLVRTSEERDPESSCYAVYLT